MYWWASERKRGVKVAEWGPGLDCKGLQRKLP